MKKLLIVMFILPLSLFAQNQSLVIYNNDITHDNIKADIFNNDTTFVYSVTTAAMWTGKSKTSIVYKGEKTDFLEFMNSLLEFAQTNKDNKGAKAKIKDIEVESTKRMGIKCITIGSGKNATNTNYESISNAIEALRKWQAN